jgi:hypothetical protein
VLAAVAAGVTNAVAAGRLGLRPETVKAYLRSAMRKLGAHRKTDRTFGLSIFRKSSTSVCENEVPAEAVPTPTTRVISGMSAATGRVPGASIPNVIGTSTPRCGACCAEPD